MNQLEVHVPPDRPDVISIAVKFSLVTLWRNNGDTEEKATFRISVQTPEDKVVHLAESEPFTLNPNAFHRWTLKMNTWNIGVQGRHDFLVSRKGSDGKWTEESVVPIDVKIVVSEDAPMVPVYTPGESKEDA